MPADRVAEKIGWMNRRLQAVRNRVEERPVRLTPAGLEFQESLQRAQRQLYAAQTGYARYQSACGQSAEGLVADAHLGVPPSGFLEGRQRRDTLRQVLRAEQALENLEGAGEWVKFDLVDWDGDRQPELLLRSRALTLRVDLRRGGRLLEMSDKSAQMELLSEAGGREHVWTPETDVQAFARGNAQELSDFGEGRYRGRIRRGSGILEAVLTRQGSIRMGGRRCPMGVTKTLALSAKRRAVTWTHQLCNHASRTLSFLFGSELCLTLRDVHVNRLGEVRGVRRFSVVDPHAQLRVSWVFRRPARLWYFPRENRFRFGSEFHRIYQGVSLTGLWPVALAPGQVWSAQWRFSVGDENGRIG